MGEGRILWLRRILGLLVDLPGLDEEPQEY